MDISNFLQGAMGVSLVDGVAKKLGVKSSVARTAIIVGLPLLIAALRKNANKPEGANGILGAVNTKHDGGILDNLSNLFSGGHDHEDGNKILGHIFGGKKSDINQAVSQKSGLDSNQTEGLMSLLAPVVMGMVGKQAKANNTDANGLSGLLGNLLTGQDNQPEANNFSSILDSFLDDDGDGSMDEIAELGSKFLGKLFK